MQEDRKASGFYLCGTILLSADANPHANGYRIHYLSKQSASFRPSFSHPTNKGGGITFEKETRLVHHELQGTRRTRLQN
jgi:hypothetical protein